MKYTEQEKYLVFNRGVNLRQGVSKKAAKLKKNFPITVHIEGDFYVIESSLNFRDYVKT
jgi:hypothetical protein